MKRLLLTWIIGFLYLIIGYTAFSQTPPNAKNVDKTAMSFYDGMQTFRALEYTVNQDPQSTKVYRLQTLPENGFPEITLQGVSQGNSVYFEDKTPYDDQFSDNNTPYLSSEAVQTFYTFQRVMKAVDQKFGWKGIDGTGQKPVTIYLKDSDDDPSSSEDVWGHYHQGPPEFFEFFRATKTSNKPFNNVLEIVGHEYAHAIFHTRNGIDFDLPDLCKESPALDEGIADVLGIYLKNKILQTPPQNFDWQYKKQYKVPAEHLGDPKSYGWPDTYFGQNYPNTCSPSFDVHPASGVLGKWFYLLVEGHQGTAYNDLNYPYGDLVGIDVEKAIQIVWEAIPSIKVYTDYKSFRSITLQATEKLYGLHSTEYLAVQNAWCAVGVCDNNPSGFSMYPANASSKVVPWPSVKINITWPNVNNGNVKKWRVETSTKFDFSENFQAAETDNFTMVVDPNGLLTHYATVDTYYRPGEKIYARAKIVEADPNFCKGLNPLCQFYQQYGPTHAFVLDNREIQFWPDNSLSRIVNPWNKPEFSWKSVEDADHYTLQVATDIAFNNLIYDGSASHTTNFTDQGEINTTLEQEKDYYLRVRAERLDFIIDKNYGKWSDVIKLHTTTPQTSILQALNQKAIDPPQTVSNLGFDVGWYPYAGATSYIIQAATDDAFLNIIRSQTVAGNVNSTNFILPIVANLTNLFVRVVPQRGAAFGLCNNTWRIKTSENFAIPNIKNPVNGTVFPFHDFSATFAWTEGSLNKGLIDHYQLEITKTAAPNNPSIFTTPNASLDLEIKDPLMFDGNFQVGIRGVNALGAKSGLSTPFNYTVCPDHPAVSFPGDLGKVDPTQNFNVEWYPSQSFVSGSQYLVTIFDGVNPIPAFNNKPTTNTSMLVPAGTLTDGKSYTVKVKNSSSCPALEVPKTFFIAKSAGGANQPQQPKLLDFSIDLKGFRNDPDGFAWGTSNYRLGIEVIDPNGDKLTLVDPNGNEVKYIDVDSENSGVIIDFNQQPEGKYKLSLKMLDVFPPITYYPFDQPYFSVLLKTPNAQTVIVDKHIITADFIDTASPFHQFQPDFQFGDIILNIK